MANDMQDTLKQLLISTIEGAGKSSNGASDKLEKSSGSGGGISGARGVAAGVGAAALAPMAIKGLGKLARGAGMNGVQDLVKSPGKAVQGLGSNLGGQVGSTLGDKVSDKVDEAGGPSGILSDTVKGVMPFGGGGGGSKGGGLGVGKGRRMPVQQSVDIAAPLETVYNQWTQFEDWPEFMHRVVRATQEDDCTVSFTAKMWTRSREFSANIETQRPNERIKWKVSEGIDHAGVVSFHELGPNLTRVLLAIDVQPGGMIEKMARGMRHVKRAARGDLHRFKAFIEMAEQETGAWRGVIEEGEVVEEHDPSYDEDREYADVQDVLEDAEGSSDDDEDDDEGEDEGEDDKDSAQAQSDDDDNEQPQASRSRRRRQQSSNGHGANEESEDSPKRSRSASRSSSSRSSGSGGGRANARSGSSGGSGSRSGGSSGGSRRSSGGSRSSSGSSSSGRRSRSRSSSN
ncbi:MAG: SRPBCC family protein [Actinomycetota bacterium]|nr:SRPBCC family protein [Actinomycetota bacterium]